MRKHSIEWECCKKGLRIHSIVLSKDKTKWNFLLTWNTITQLNDTGELENNFPVEFDTLQEVLSFVKSLPSLGGYYEQTTND